MINFEYQWKVATKKLKSELTTVYKNLAYEIFKSIVEKTTVGNPSQWRTKAPKNYKPGKLKGNWFADINQASKTQDDNIRDTSGKDTITKIKRNLQGLTINDKATLANNQPYAAKVEYGEYPNRPAGMVRRTLANIQALQQKAQNRKTF